MAERAHLSRNAINALERGTRRSPRKDTVTLLAAALALSDEQHAALLAVARLHGSRAAATAFGVAPVLSPSLSTPSASLARQTPIFNNLSADSPLQQTLDAARHHNLPVPPNPLVG